jgi:hypothetical protein
VATQAFKITANHGRTTDEPHGVSLVRGVGYLAADNNSAVLAHRIGRDPEHTIEPVDEIPAAYTELVGDPTPMSPRERRMADIMRANQGNA